MEEQYVEAFDTESRRSFSASDLAQLLLTVICLASSAYLIMFTDPLKWTMWHYFMFFGNLIWLVFLFLTSIVQFKNERTRSFVNAVDWVYLGFHAAMFVWANLFFWGNSSPVEAENYWVFIYLIFGFIAVAVILSTLFMTVLKIVNKKRLERENPEKLELGKIEDNSMMADQFADDYA